MIALVLAACAPASRPVDSADEAAPPGLELGAEAPRNLVIVQVDTLRADALPTWGSARDTFPLLGGRPGWVAVDRAVSTASWTAPASASLLTGLDQPAHGVRVFDPDGPNLGVTAPTFAEHLRDLGFETALFTGSQVLVGEEFGLGDGFETTRLVDDEPANGAAVVDGAGRWLVDRVDERPFLLFLQPMDPHAPYVPAPGDLGTWSDPDALPFDLTGTPDGQEGDILTAWNAAGTAEGQAAVQAQVRAVYDEQLLGLDRALDTLFGALDASGHLDDTLVVLVGDHGESFFDGPPTVLGHGGTVRNEIVHVPLLFWRAGMPDAPAGMPPADCVASNMDVFPTALDLMGVAALPDTEGHSLRTGCRTWAFSGSYELYGGVERLTWMGVESAEAQVVFDCTTRTSFAFDLTTDPAATRSVGPEEVPGGAALRDALDGYRRGVLGTLPRLVCDTD